MFDLLKTTKKIMPYVTLELRTGCDERYYLIKMIFDEDEEIGDLCYYHEEGEFRNLDISNINRYSINVVHELFSEHIDELMKWILE